MSLPTTVIAGITVPDTPLVKAAIRYAESELPPWVFNHVMRSWLFAVQLAKTAGEKVDEETLAVAVILHDFGLVLKYESSDRRFEVDGAAAAVAWLKAQRNDDNDPEPDSVEYFKHKLRELLVWDAIALHTTFSVAHHSVAEVAFCQGGIGIDFLGQGIEQLPDATQTVKAVLRAYPRLGMKDDLRERLCSLVRNKPETTYDNFVGAFGEAYVKGYVQSNIINEQLVKGLRDNPLETLG